MKTYTEFEVVNLNFSKYHTDTDVVVVSYIIAIA